MTAAKKIRISVQEYLDQEEKTLSKNEFIEGRLVATAGSSPTHNLIAVNCASVAWFALKNKNCRVFNSDQRVKSKSGHAFVYPDISIVCGTPELDSRGNLSNPKVIFEVLSDSTEKHDRS
ncbi:Uma2 family endonuclease [Telmatocola sphagniphila]|uniref:Uma2 family endonuclease n=1 Tax=Telmatocola sphagniphila TaxID=1123043 RepID=A0A8E6B931_9BACT|nr:Uma2 family endonuclease [Telmatocola sphagniphila]QVL33396.1 Uma2 family endonuclease [Telmatocola sphagniphila]